LGVDGKELLTSLSGQIQTNNFAIAQSSFSLSFSLAGFAS
jgi:hypothetical protein